MMKINPNLNQKLKILLKVNPGMMQKVVELKVVVKFDSLNQ